MGKNHLRMTSSKFINNIIRVEAFTIYSITHSWWQEQTTASEWFLLEIMLCYKCFDASWMEEWIGVRITVIVVLDLCSLCKAFRMFIYLCYWQLTHAPNTKSDESHTSYPSIFLPHHILFDRYSIQYFHVYIFFSRTPFHFGKHTRLLCLLCASRD